MWGLDAGEPSSSKGHAAAHTIGQQVLAGSRRHARGSGCAVWRPGHGGHSLGESGSLHQPCPAGSPGEPPRETPRESGPGQGMPQAVRCSQAGLVSGDPGAGAMPPREAMRPGSSGTRACGDG